MDLQARHVFLSRTTLLGGLPATMLAALARDVKLRELTNGQTLIEQGAEGHSLFFVVDGRLEARLTVPGNPPRVTVLGGIRRGEVVGEMAVLSDQLRMCAVVAVRQSRVLELARADFLAIVAQQPEVLFGLTDALVRRRSEALPGDSTATTVAIIPQSPKVDANDFARALWGKMIQWGRTGLLSEKDALGRAAGDARTEMFSRFERRNERVLYVGQAGNTEWTQSILRQADLILLVADADTDPSLSEFERAMLFGESPISSAPVALVLVHPDGQRAPSGTARWLGPRNVRLHHHVALNAPDDFARLARNITGNSNHLVLSGGGVRGFAHIGVLRALAEANIPIDFIGGTSVGAGIAAFGAMRYPAQRIADTLRPFLRNATDLTLPMLALSSGKKATQALQAMIGEPLIEDLWLNYFAVSADLQRAEEFIHRRGPLWLAVRASTSLPGFYPPVPTDDRYLVDGGVLNNLPVDVMAALHPGRILAVDVSQESTLEFTAPPPLALSGWQLLFRRLNPFRQAPRDPSIADVLIRSGEIAAVAMSRINKARTPIALSIRPPVAKYRMLDFSAFDAIIEEGYRYTCELVAKWPGTPEPDEDSRFTTLRDGRMSAIQSRDAAAHNP